MRGMKRFLTSGLFVFFSVALLNAFSKENILSPVEGTWNNPQPLVIDVPDGWEVYFSYSSENPLESGLVYDSPVENEQTGNISLYVIAVDPEGNRTNVTVKFTVTPVKPFISDLEINSSFQEINRGSIITLPSGRRFSIPNGYTYCLGRNKKPVSKAKDIFVSESNMLEKYVPCTLSDGKSKWRFVIHTVSSKGEGDFEQTAPFIINDWNEIAFMNDNFIYQVDEGLWGPATKPFKIDRTNLHIIRWQDVSYREENAIYSMKLPPKPELVCTITKRKSVVYSISENSKFQLKANNKTSVNGTIPEEIFNSIELDVFDGDEAFGSVNFSVYYEGLYQGELEAEYSLDRQSPDSPEFISTTDKDFAHEKVKVSIEKQPSAEIYYSISKPVTSVIGFEGVSKETFDSIPTGSYKKYSGRTFVLSSSKADATFYKISAYAVDERGNKSDVSEYRVIVDESNYYLSAKGQKINLFSDRTSEEPDGSISNPFTSFEQALATINSNVYTKIHISGNVDIKENEINVMSNCMLIGNQSHITIPPFCTINIINSDFEAVGCHFEKSIPSEIAESYVTREQDNAINSMFNISNSNVIFDECDVKGLFGHHSVMFYAKKSKFNIRNCTLTANALDYSCIVVSDESEINALNTDFTAVASTATCISATGGILKISECLCSSIGHLCHVAELNTSHAEFRKNIFSIRKEDSSLNSEIIWKNAGTELIEYGNITNDEY